MNHTSAHSITAASTQPITIPKPTTLSSSSLLTENSLLREDHHSDSSSSFSSSLSNNNNTNFKPHSMMIPSALPSNLIRHHHTPNPLLMSSQVMKTVQDAVKDEKIKKLQSELLEKQSMISQLESRVEQLEETLSTQQVQHENELECLKLKFLKENEEKEQTLKFSHEQALLQLNLERKAEFEKSQQQLIEQEFVLKEVQNLLSLSDSKDIVRTLSKFVKKYKKEKEANKALEDRGKQLLTSLNDVAQKFKEYREKSEKEFEKKNREIEGQQKEIFTLRMELAVVQRQLEYNRTHIGGLDTDTDTDATSSFAPSSPTSSITSSPTKSPIKASTPKKFLMANKKTPTLQSLSPGGALRDITNVVINHQH
nr:unnamed protein product [Naegleria fowleri]